MLFISKNHFGGHIFSGPVTQLLRALPSDPCCFERSIPTTQTMNILLVSFTSFCISSLHDSVC